MMRKLLIVLLFSFILFFTSLVAAAPAEKMSVQGRLTDPATGDAMTGTYSMNFSLYDAPSAGNRDYSEVLSVTTDSNGLYSVVLTPTDESIFADPLWMALKVAADSEMTPRMNLTTSPYAFQALDLQCTDCIGGTEIDESTLDDVEVGTVTNTYGCYGTAGNVVACNDAGFTYAIGTDALTIVGSINVGSSGLFANSTHVGIGTASPSHELTVVGDINVSGGDLLGAAGASIDLGEATAGLVTIVGSNITLNANDAAADTLITLHNKQASYVADVYIEGDVGIGENTPLAPLHIYDSVTSTSGTENMTIIELSTSGSASDGWGAAIRFHLNDISEGYDWGGRIANVLNGADDDHALVLEAIDSGVLNTNQLWLDSIGSVGVGTSTFSNDKFRVQESRGADYFAITGTNGSSWVSIAPRLNTGGYNDISQAGDMGIIFSKGGAGTGALVIAPYDSPGTATGLRITSVGKVGIGTANPDEDLHIASSSPKMIIYREDVIGNQGVIGDLYFGGSDDADNNDAARIRAITPSAGGAWNSSETPADITFSTTPKNSLTITERMRISSEGFVGIGTTLPVRDLHISDTMRITPRATAPSSPSAGDIYVDSTAINDELCFYNGNVWVGVSSGGTCA
ncbi:hypothetical protein GOV07_02825 [Candidatus Woesearchaeota archaeon]|nr:hypothetical protein [Candidatus Woesearchaeota archaeon]